MLCLQTTLSLRAVARSSVISWATDARTASLKYSNHTADTSENPANKCMPERAWRILCRTFSVSVRVVMVFVREQEQYEDMTRHIVDRVTTREASSF